MNERELKKIWKSLDEKDLPEFDYEYIRKSAIGLHNKLRRKIKIDVAFGIILMLAVILICFVLPKLIFYVPVLAALYVWHFRKHWKIYKQGSLEDNFVNTREFLENKTALITTHIRESRILYYSTMPLIAFSTFFLNATVVEIWNARVAVLLLLIIIEIFVIAYCEIYFRIMYIPSVKKYRELIEQLEAD